MKLPPLRDRREDIGLLVGTLFKRVARSAATHPGLECDALRQLFAYDWPLNVRELEQALSSAVVLAGDSAIALEHLPDSVRNYLTKFLDDRWMRESGFDQPDWAIGRVEDIIRALPPKKIITLDIAEKISNAISVFKEKGISQVPITDDGKLAGILTETDLLHVIVDGRASNDSSIAEIMERQVATVPMHADSAVLPTIFDRGEVAIVIDDERRVQGLLTKLDLIDYMTRSAGKEAERA